MAKASQHIPPGYGTLTVHVTVPGCADYIEFLKRAFNAVEIGRSPGPGGKLMHANVKIGDTIMMLNDTFPEMGGPPIAEGNWPLRLNLYVPDADATWAQALANGCQVVFPLQDQFWGDRYGQLRDPSGFVWAIATHIEDLTPEEIEQRAAAVFGRYPVGQPSAKSLPSPTAVSISDCATLFPSPMKASFNPASRPKRSRIVSTSASAWQGWYASESALITGTQDHCASASTVLCANTRATIPLTQRSRFRATSFSGSRTPMGPSQNTDAPPICEMASSNVSLVRSDGFSKSIPMDLPPIARA